MVAAGLLSSAKSTWKHLGELAWHGVIRGVVGVTEVAGVSSRARATRMVLPVAQASAKGRATRMGLPEGRARATRMDLSGAEGKATRTALVEGRVLKVAGVAVASRPFPPEGITGGEAGVAMLLGYAKFSHFRSRCCLQMMLVCTAA